jgi:hypothetical protein
MNLNFRDQLTALRKQQFLLGILVFSFVTVMVWAASSLFQTQRETKIDPALIKLARSLNPTINQEILSKIEEKRSFSAGELSNFPIYKLTITQEGTQQVSTIGTDGSPGPTSSVTPSPSPTASASPAATNSNEFEPVTGTGVGPTATQSGNTPGSGTGLVDDFGRPI